MKNITLVESMRVKGHVNLNKYLVKKFLNHGFRVELMLPESSLQDYDELSDIVDIVSVKCKNKLFIFEQIEFYFNLYRMLQKNASPNKILFLSYYPPIFLFFSKCIRVLRRKFFVFEHNTVPNKLSSILRKLIFKLIDKKITHICFLPFIAEHLVRQYSKSTITFIHPLTELKTENKKALYDDYYFCPSKSVQRKDLITLLRIMDDSSINSKVLCKYDISDSRVIYKNIFEEYSNLIENSIAIFNPVNFDYRVSGVAFEAIGCNKVVIGNENMFFNSLKEIYPNNVVFIECYSKSIKLPNSPLLDAEKLNALEFNKFLKLLKLEN
ncbi:hypothetical protein [Colwellia piezophila]|uniref:hypothetical protein n=1 Tax=Colwellia piezophila TaxID=211668 RepID=UPI00036DB089|nr:hypothetical protein [Colwellia piezophila]